MRKAYGLLCLISLIVAGLCSSSAFAVSGDVVISQVQVGNSNSARNEIIELYNNSSSDVDITNWCLYYASAASSNNGSKLACFTPSNDSEFIFLPTHSLALAVSTNVSDSSSVNWMVGDLQFSPKLSNISGHIRLQNNLDETIDKVGWGESAVSPEGQGPADMPGDDQVVQRYNSAPNILVDSDENSIDFILSTPRPTYLFGYIYKIQDVCVNLEGAQELAPDSFVVGDTGECTEELIDVCNNISDIQTEVPDGMEIDGFGNCVAKDVCANIPDIQHTVPSGYELSADDTCSFIKLPIQITELLPNSTGSDKGNEFIEIYNPNDVTVYLDNYEIIIGSDSDVYRFPSGAAIEPGEYGAFYNTNNEFTLINTTSSLKIASHEGDFIYEVPVYVNPEDNFSWALIDEKWQYTNHPTPGQANVKMTVSEKTESLTVSTLKPCGTNQYRSTETNRCRNVNPSSSSLASCAVGQERNPATNRCRSIASVLGASDVKPCEEGKERNPETNRCRTIISMPAAAYTPQPTEQASGNYIGWWVIGGIATLAIGYGAWEWRQSFGRAFSWLGSLRFKK